MAHSYLANKYTTFSISTSTENHMKIAISQLRRIIAEETRRVLAEGRYDAVAAAVMAGDVDVDGELEESPAGYEFIETFKNAVAPVIEDDDAVYEEIDAALAALKAAGATRADIESTRQVLQSMAQLVASDLETTSSNMDYEIEDERERADRETKGAAQEAAFNAIIARLGGDRAFMAKLVPLLNKKLSATKSKEKSMASKAVTAAVEAAMTDEDFGVTDPIKVHNELQRRLLAHMERKRGR